MRRFRRLLMISTILLGVLALAGCSTLSDVGFYWNLWRASRQGERFRNRTDSEALDIAYSDRSDVTLDVYSPETGTGYPVLIFVHGGGWDKYEKELFAPVAMQVVPKEIVVVIPDYTLYPEAGYEQMSREVADSVAWTLENIAVFGGDPSRIVLSGHSAGGHLSGLVAFDPMWLGETGHHPNELCGWIGLSGVYDVNAQMAFERSTGGQAPVMTAVMGGEANFAATSPAEYVGDDAYLAVTLIHGRDDETVPVSITESMALRLTTAGWNSTVHLYETGGHSGFLFDALSNDDARVLVDIAEAVGACGLR